MGIILKSLTRLLLLQIVSLSFFATAQVCDSTNSPVYNVKLLALNPSINGTCGIIIVVDSLTSKPPGMPVSFAIYPPNTPTTPVFPSPTLAIAYTSGIYTVIAMQIPNFCMTTKTVQINIPQAPTISVSPSITPLCSAQANFLVASGATSYTWHTGTTGPSIVTNPSYVLSYTVRGANVDGCQAKLQGSITAQLSPTIVPVPSSFTTCINQAITFTATGANTYTWNNTLVSNQFTSSTFTTLGNNTYTLTLKGTNTAGCTSAIFYNQNFYVDQCDVGVTEVNSKTIDGAFEVFPNPTHDILSLNNSSPYQVTCALIHDYAGNVVLKTDYEAKSRLSIIDVTALKPGLYLLTLLSTEGPLSTKFIKQ